MYATCSVLPDENQNIVQGFLSAHPEFELMPAREVLAAQKIEIPESAERAGCLQLLPHLHHTDGLPRVCSGSNLSLRIEFGI